MDRECIRCQTLHASHANFCAVCGLQLTAYRLASTVKSGRLLLAVVAAAAVTFGVFSLALTKTVTITRSFHLPHSNADAVYQLLRPSDVKVVVSRERDGIRVSGTPGEIAAVAEFTKLLTRHQDCLAYEVQRRMAESRKDWSTREKYKLSNSKAKMLFDALAPEDIPVLVQRSGRYLRVDATSEDQQTVRQMVSVLRGRRP